MNFEIEIKNVRVGCSQYIDTKLASGSTVVELGFFDLEEREEFLTYLLEVVLGETERFDLEWMQEVFKNNGYELKEQQ